jgi:muramoyltetrapeptide carboxypeptidase
MATKSKQFVWPQSVDRKKDGRKTVGIVVLSAPEAHPNPEHLQRGIRWLEQRGFTVRLAPHVKECRGFLAGPPEQVAHDFHAMLADSDVSWIVSAGGGYNSNSLLRHLDFDLMRRARKPVIGLSNPTLLLNALTAKSGVISFHGPVLLWNLGSEDGGPDEFTEEWLWRMLGHRDGEMVIPREPSWTWPRPGACTGRLLGGNLWSLQQLLGTPYEPDWTGAIVAIEDCFCELHQVAAILEHFACAGVFDRIAGLLVGVPLEVKETELPCEGDFTDVVMAAVEASSFPVLTGVHFGHTDRKITLPIGARATLDAAADAIVIHVNERNPA